MSQIELQQPDNAPNYSFAVQQVDGNGNVFIQTDWEYPGIAATFGWSPSQCKPNDLDEDELADMTPEQQSWHHKQCRCEHKGTDGTVDCKDCGLEATDFIASAYDFLQENEGKIVEDPGYFG